MPGHSRPADAAPFARLSPAARTVWAKHDRRTESWLPLWRHMADSSAVAEKLWDAWVPANVKALIAESLPGGEADARFLLSFLAASHDTGKATPAFACQVISLSDRMHASGLHMLPAKEYGTDRRIAPHGLAGQLLLQEWLADRHGLSPRASGQFAVVAGGHHGRPPEHQQILDLRLRPHLLRHPGPSEALWKQVQYELLDGCADLTGAGDRLPAWRSVRLPQPAQVLLTAVVILADWIASATELFPYEPESWQPYGPAGEQRRIEAAWRGLDLPGPWAIAEPAQATDVLFAERFDLPGNATVRPVQAEAVRVARAMPTPGLLVIEAPMGEGKTEAAFAAAEVLAARTGAGGCLVALPTRATSDAMFPRLLDWLGRLPHDEPRSVVLAHAKAALNETWAGMMRAEHRSIAAVESDRPERLSDLPAPTGAARQEPAGLHAHQWLRGRKKSLLSSFAVGTVDQVLFAGLKSRHLALRHLAVAGKVVIIDEVHAYDAYMNRYLDRVLEWLAAYRVPVVLLSATLPAGRRQQLLSAYSGQGSPARADGHADGSADTGYPLITAAGPGDSAPALVARPAAAAGRRTEVTVERLDDDTAVLADRLAVELADGGCALVVRNTVDRVLEAAAALRRRFGPEAVTVSHSRFLAADRAVKDTQLRERFGPRGSRPTEAHIVVASQVIEQSLDVDFDLLVTDLAPVDLMLQRMGRLHRHPRSRPSRLADARCLVTGVADWYATPPPAVPGTRAVYQGEHALLRALAVLGPHLDGAPLVLPTDISPLVQTAYGDGDIGPVAWSSQLHAARTRHRGLLAEKREKAEALLLGPVGRPGRPVVGWLGAGAGDTDDTLSGRAQVRDTSESLEVLVIQRLRDGRLTTVPWLKEGHGGLDLPTDFAPGRQSAEAAASSALTLPWQFCHPGIIDRTIAELERALIPAWQVKECPWLAGQLLLVLDEDCQTHLSGFVLRYSRDDGLFVSPSEATTAARTVPQHDPTVFDEEDDVVRETAQERGTTATTVPTLPTARNDGDGAVPGPPSFDLVSRPWLPVQRLDGGTEEVSLRDIFLRSAELRRLVGDLPTQEFALLRLLLAVAHDALGGPEHLEDWAELWQNPHPFSPVEEYLRLQQDRFDLLHPHRPFFQVADLRTAKGEISSLNRIVADVPTGEPFFTMRRPDVDRLSCAEAARWLVHAHAFDPSGIKSGMCDDDRATSGKVYPLGVGSAGHLGGVHAEGATLQETLLLNLVPFSEGVVEVDGSGGTRKDDLPAWRHDPYGPGESQSDTDGPRRPRGLRDLYTWQSRRVRLHHTGETVTGVVLGYGDRLTLHAPWKLEPMSCWRRSPAQEKKQRRAPVYLPRQHDPSRSAWRGLAALLPNLSPESTGQDGTGRPEELAPALTRWLSMLVNEGELPPDARVRLRMVSAVYGTQQSVIQEIVDDSVVLPVVLLHQDNPVYGAAAVDAVKDADDAVRAVGHLAGNLARASGTDPDPAVAAARDLAFGMLDGPYRAWLVTLAEHSDPQAAREEWRHTVRDHLLRLSRDLLNAAGTSVSEGRLVDIPGTGKRWIDDARAELWFRRKLFQVLPPRDTAASDH
ncbi:type I-E CRISPR-associated protein Cse1/CasA [Streptomyces sp. XM4011]|uniref:type I-E CRISPR-associated protein Cse1/CasA n=1 Tax=Streptomyces sp. XM4011 TaxID=2929780 RepID=UPI001FFAAA6C|nr:type I-E CRISPR-associated protein Cse1/CasA [Streptomyces sp. XM4011]MCK1816239.1 type I-E CRISPR-associated protein Cse1/CasA [Streptomyces sp. XM4011]